MLPFTREQFLAVFVSYNEAIWPLQVAAYLLGFLAVALLVAGPRPAADRVISAVLSAMWVWTGVAYHANSFAGINRLAWLFGLLFVVQGVLLAYAGVVRRTLRFGFRSGAAPWIGSVLVAYSAFIYPAISTLTGHAYPEMPVFGVTPCPVAIFTFGMLLLTTAPFSRWLLVIPFLWSLAGGSAAFLLGILSDWVLLVTGVVAVPLIIWRDRGMPQQPRTA